MFNLNCQSTIALALAWGITSFIPLTSTKAQSIQSFRRPQSGQLYFSSSPSVSSADDFEEEGRPLHRTAGGDRNLCQRLIALIPGDGEIQNQPQACHAESVSFPTLTVAEFPSFWFYIPDRSTPGLSAEFVLLDEQEQPVLIQPIALSPTSGVVSVSPPHSLEIGKQYRWIFSLLTHPDRPSRNPAVEGFIRRIEPETALMSQLESAISAREWVAIYAHYGIWHDAITTLAALRHTAPTDDRWLTDWADLLSSVGLGAIAPAPIVDCCITAEERAGSKKQETGKGDRG